MPKTTEPFKDGVKEIVDPVGFGKILEGYQFDVCTVCFEHIWDFGAAALGTKGGQFHYARSYGEIMGILKWLDFDYRWVAPKAWQTGIGCPKFPAGPEGYKQRKAWIVQKIQAEFPLANLIPKRCRVPSDGRADATAIALYGIYRDYMERFGGKKRR